MKKILFVLASLSLFAACSKEAASPVAEGFETITASVEDNGTKVQIATSDSSTFTHNWVLGDKISIFDGETNVCYYATSVSTTTATFKGTSLTQSAPFYAIYPYNSSAEISGAEVTKVSFPATQTYTAGSYDPEAIVMIAKADTKGDQFNFKIASSLMQIKLTPSANYTVKSVEITANGGESIAGTGTVNYNAGVPTVTMGDGGLPTITVTFGTGVDLTAGTAYTFYVAIPAVTLSSGLSIAVTSSENKVLLKNTTSTTNFARNSVTKMPALTAKPSVLNLALANSAAVGLSTPETANCYMLENAGTYAIPIDMKGNGVAPYSETIDLKGITGVGVVWAKNNNIANCKLYGKYMTFDATGTPGNAVVKAIKAGTIVWSWHVWTSDYDLSTDGVTCTVSGNQVKYFSRFLGASEYDSTRDYYYDGPVYCAGRKDPFPGNKTDYDAFITIEDAQNTVAYSITKPNVFIGAKAAKSTSQGGTGYGSWTTSPDLKLWSNGETTAKYSKYENQTSIEKTMYDPCPVGYHIPSGLEVKYYWDGKTSVFGDKHHGSQLSLSNTFTSMANTWTYAKYGGDFFWLASSFVVSTWAYCVLPVRDN